MYKMNGRCARVEVGSPVRRLLWASSVCVCVFVSLRDILKTESSGFGDGVDVEGEWKSRFFA